MNPLKYRIVALMSRFVLLFLMCLSAPVMALDKVTVQLKWFNQFQFAGYYAAVEKGFYAEEGLDVTLRERDPDKGPVDEVVAGTAQYGVADSGLILARDAGQPVVLLAQIFQHSPLIYLALRDSGLRTPYDLKGRKVMTDAYGANDAPLKAMVANTLGDVSQVQWQPLSYNNEDLLNGKTDAMLAYSSNEPFWFGERGVKVNLIEPRDYGIDFYGDNLFTTREEVKSNPERVRKMLRATLRGWKYALENQEEIVDLILARYNTQKHTRKHLLFEAKQIEKVVLPGFVELGHIEKSRLEKISEIYRQQGLTASHAVPQDFLLQEEDSAPPALRDRFTDEEKKWISENTVRVGIEDWPPIVFMRDDGTAGGVAGGYLELVQKKTGLRFEFVSGLWDTLLTALREGELDLLPATYYTQERSTYGLYSEHYFTMREFIYVRENNDDIQSIYDLKQKRIAVVKGYGTIPKLKGLLPNATIVETDSLLQSINLVLNGEVDALVEAQLAVEVAIKRNALLGLKGISQDVFPASPLHFFSRKDAPLLQSILQKGLNAISEQEQQKILGRWLSSSTLNGQQGDRVMGDDTGQVLVIAAAAVIILLILAVYLLPRMLSDEVIANLVGSSRFRVGILTVTGLVFVIVLGLIWYTLQLSKQSTLENVEQDLRFVLEATEERVDEWIQDRSLYLRELGRDEELVALTRDLLAVPADGASLKASKAQARIRSFFIHRQSDFGETGFFIINPDRISVGSQSNTGLGTRNLIEALRPKLLERAFHGETLFVPHIRSAAEVTGPGGEVEHLDTFSMFFLTPVLEEDGTVIAVLAQRLKRGGRLSRVLQRGTVGRSGESYLVNDQGDMITQSRFTEELESLGLIKARQEESQVLPLRDPGGDLTRGYQPTARRSEQAYTFLAQAILHLAELAQGVSQMPSEVGVNMESYRDYRGVPVMGVWRWLPDVGAGIATEIDVSEALSAFSRMRLHLLIATVTTLLLALALSLLTVTVGQRATRFMQQSRDELEEKVAERTTELSEREQRMWDMYENAPTPYASISPVDGRFQKHNKAFAELLRRDRADFRELKWASLTVGDDVADVLAEVGQGAAMMDRELRIERADGERMYVLLSALPARNGQGDIDEIRLTLIDVTERKAAEKRFASLMESAPDAMVVINEGGDLVLVNSQVEKVFGYDRKELLGNKIEMLVPEDIREAHVGYRSHYFATPETRPMGADLLLRGQRKNGEVFPVEVSLSPIQTDEGTLAVAVARDITERRKTEESIARSNRDLATLTLVNEAVMQALTEEQLLYDVCRILVEANDKRFVWIGYEQRDADKSIRQVARYGYEKGFLSGVPYTWDKEPARQGPTGRVIRSAKAELVADVSSDEDYAIWRDAAVDRDYGSVLAVPLASHGDAFGAITLYSDQTNGFDEDNIKSLERVAENVAHGIQALRSEALRKVTEVELQETEERSRLLLESVDEGIFGLDDDGRVTFVNGSGAHMLGWGPDELVGRKMHALTHHSHADGSHYAVEDCPMHDSYVHGSSHRIDDEVLWRKDGSSFAAEYSSLPIYKGEHLMGAVVSFRDVSALKKLAEELKIAKEAADDANQAKGSFLANMSHEIRTPMNAIIGLSHLLLGTELNRKQQDYLTKVYGSAQNLLGIINDILDFSKIEAGKMDMEVLDFDLQQELDNIASIVGIKAGEKSLEFLVDHPMDLPMDLHGDPLRLGQVIINLANNAVKFTDEGSVTVRIRLLEENDDGYQMRFEVIDTGIGMTEEQMSRLFKAFSQADTSTTRKYGGTGLGLTISKRLVEMMEGEIGVESAPGTGSTFWFTARFGKAKSEVRRSLTVDADFKDLKTLVVDDNAISREILTRICESFGFDVHEAASGAEALEELGSEQNLKTPYKLVLLDWKMPGMNGMELATLVSEDPAHYGDPHMVMVSAYGREDLMQQAQDLHLDGYLVKPVNASMLFDTVMQAFGKQVESAPRAGLGDTPQAPPELRGAHLLLAEDNEINQEVAVEILQQAGFRVSVAEDGQVALDMLDADPEGYSGVLMDMHMPVMDGIEATKQIRAQPRFAELPVLAMTAAALSTEKQRCLDAGMNAHITKPIDVPELVHTLVEWLKPVATKSDQAPDDRPVDMPAGPTAVDSLPEIEGIDSADGLRRVGGNQSLYRRLLGKYLLSQADVIERIRTSLSEQDQQTATREAHTLKSVSGNIGALGIAEVAARIESTLHKGETDIEAMLVELDQVLNPVLAQLRARLGNEAPQDKTPTQPPMDPEQLGADLQQLHGLLKEMDTEANELAERLFAGLRGTEQGRIMKQVLDALSGYDFDKALSLLEGLQASTNDGSSS